MLITAQARNHLPYRNIGGALIMCTICSSSALLISSWCIDHLHIFNESFYAHLRTLLLNTSYYIDFLNHNKLRALAFYSLPVFSTFFVCTATWTYFGRVINPTIHIAGRRLLHGKEAAVSARRATAKEVRASGYGLRIHPALALAKHQELTSFLFLAGQRGGKTQVLSRVLEQSWARNDKTISFDMKTDFTVITPPTKNGIEPLLFAPWDARSMIWNVAADVDELHKAKAFSAGIIPANDRDPMWSNAARALLVAIIMKQITMHGKKWGWEALGADAFLPIQDLKEIAELYYTPALAIVADAESKTAGSVMINLHAFLGPLFDLRAAWGGAPSNRRVSLDKWLKNDNTKYRNIVIQGNMQHLQLSQALIKSMIETMVCILASPAFPQSRTRRIIFTMDEFVQFGKLDSIQIIPELLASRGCVLIVAIQSIDQIRKVYGNEITGIFGNIFQTKIFGRIVGANDLKWVQEQVGQRIVSTPSGSVSTSGGKSTVSKHFLKEEVQVVRAEDLESLGMISLGKLGRESKANEIYIRALVLGHGQDALVLEWPLWVHPKHRKDHIHKTIHVRPSDALVIPEESKILADADASPNRLQPLAERAPTDSSLEILPAQTHDEIKDEDATLELNREQLDTQTTILNLFENQPTVHNEYSDKDDATQEAAGTIAGNAMTSVVSHAIGLPEPIIDIVENILDLSNEYDQESIGIIAHNTIKKKTRKPRKYGHQNEV